MYLYTIFFFPGLKRCPSTLSLSSAVGRGLWSLGGVAVPQEQGSNRLASFNFSHMHMFPLFIRRKENPLQPPNVSAQPLRG